MQLLGKIIIIGQIKAVTGLHIGRAQSGINIGGVDNSVIKNVDGKPYIPGSSLRGKLRSLLEKSEGLAYEDKMVWVKMGEIRIHMCDEENCCVCNIFGRNNGKHKRANDSQEIEIKNTSPSRLIVRDAFLLGIPEEIKENLELEWTEVKFENSLDRITSAANPRQTERVPQGAIFELELIYNVFSDDDITAFNKLISTLKLLEDDYLGGGGSRGYGKVEFININIYWNSATDYENGKADITKKEPVIKDVSVSQLLEELKDGKFQEKLNN